MFLQCLRSSTLGFWRKHYLFKKKTNISTEGDAVTITHETLSRIHSYFSLGISYGYQEGSIA